MSTVAILNRMLAAAWRHRPGDQFGRLLFDTEGQDLIEYALVTTFIGLAGAAAWTAIQTTMHDGYLGINNGVWNLWEPKDPAVTP